MSLLTSACQSLTISVTISVEHQAGRSKGEHGKNFQDQLIVAELLFILAVLWEEGQWSLRSGNLLLCLCHQFDMGLSQRQDSHSRVVE